MAEIRVTYRGVSGREWPLTDSTLEPVVLLAAGGLKELAGRFTVDSLKTPGVAGELDLGMSVEPITGSLPVIVRADVREDFISDWAVGVGAAAGVLVVEGGRISPLELPVRLAAVPAPPDVQGVDYFELDLSIRASGGVWLRHHQGVNNVTVTNYGDVMVWPEIVWSGRGGGVVLPSGARFTLPAVSGERRVSLNPYESLTVVLDDGRVDRDVTRAVRAAAFSEGVAPHSRADYALPNGAVLHWAVGFLDPWKG